MEASQHHNQITSLCHTHTRREPRAESQRPTMADSEQPEQVLVVEDSEIGVEKWVSPAELKAREDEEQRAREAAGSDDTAERALDQMMGGTLAGADAIGVLDKVMRKESPKYVHWYA